MKIDKDIISKEIDKTYNAIHKEIMYSIVDYLNKYDFVKDVDVRDIDDFTQNKLKKEDIQKYGTIKEIKLLEGFEDEFNYLLELVQTGKIYDEPLVLHDRYKEAQDAAKLEEDGDSEESKEKNDRCRAVTKSGKKCRNKAVPGSGYCKMHSEYAEEDSQIKDVVQLMKELIE